MAKQITLSDVRVLGTNLNQITDPSSPDFGKWVMWMRYAVLDGLGNPVTEGETSYLFTTAEQTQVNNLITKVLNLAKTKEL